MTTDFRTFTNSGLRNITYNGVNSLSDLGILITKDSTKVSDLYAKSITDDLPYRQGTIDSSRANGELYYKPRTLVYKFKVFGEDRDDLIDKEGNVLAWLNSSGNYRIADSDYGGDWEFTNCVLKSIQTERGERSNADAEYEYITATFEAAPFVIAAGSVRERVYKFTAYGNSSLYILGNKGIISPAWTAEPVTVTNAVLIDIPEGVTSSAQKGFHLTGIPSAAVVTEAFVLHEGTTLREITMLNNSDGLFLGTEGDTLQITYEDEIAPTLCTGGDVKTTYNVSSPFTYRFECFTESTPTVKINNTAISLTQGFTMPASALMTIQTTGYGYYELWHDTTERRL